MNCLPPRRIVPALLCCALGAPGILSGQTLPTDPPAPIEPAPGPDPAEPVIQLSPFEVTTDQDRGYVAVNSLAGGRTNTPLRLTPSAISSLTRGFLDDLQITNIRDSFPWTLNVAPGNIRQNETPFGDYEFNFRGTGSTGNYPTRNYFLYYGVGDSYNTERFEFARGPNSILFGDAQLGGVATTFTKVPLLNKNIGQLLLQYDTFDGKRATIDANQAVNERLAIRVNALYERGAGWRDNSTSQHEAGDLAVLYKFNEDTQLRVEGEIGRVKRKVYSTNYFDQASFWDRTTTYNGVTPIANTQAAGVNTFSSTPYYVFIPGVPEAGYSNWATFYRTNGTGLALDTTPRANVPNSPVLPKREFNLGPPDSDAIVRYHSLTTWLDHRFTERLQAQLSGYTFEDAREANNTEIFNAYQIDVNTVLPNGQPNPKFGQAFAETSPSRQKQKRGVDEVRALLTYQFPLDWAGLRQRFSIAGGLRWEKFSVKTYNLRQVGGPSQNPAINAPENIVRYRLYWDEPLRYHLGGLPTAPGYTFAYAPVGWFYREEKALKYSQIASNTTLWDERVSILLGMRADHVDRDMQNPIYSNGPTRLGPVMSDSASAVTSSAGFVAYPVKALGVFFNYSENFAPVTAGPNKIDGSSFGPTRGRGVDYGLKLSLLDGMIYGTASRYESKQSGRIAGDGKIGIVRGIWTNFGATDPALTTIDYRDTEALEATGYEFEIVANPTKNLRISAGLAFPETETVDLLPGLKAYYTQNIALWQSALTNGTATNPTALQSELDNLRQALANATAGTELNGTHKYTANIYATYEFVDGPLDGLSFGAGAWSRGQQKIGSADPRILYNTNAPTNQQRQDAAFVYQYAPEYYSVAAHLAYETEIDGRRAKFQINVSNLLDNDDPLYLSYNVYRQGGLPTAPLVQQRGFYNLQDPRKITFTATFEF
jgi:hypothetical protein